MRKAQNRLILMILPGRQYQFRMTTVLSRSIHSQEMCIRDRVEDVTGFMVHGGKNSLYSGYWKVYADVAKKLEIFKQFEMAKEMLIRLVSSGVSMEEIIGYYNENILQTAVV